MRVPGHKALLVANIADALVGLVQINAVELHLWESVALDLAHPDRAIFDLDPDPPQRWSATLDVASLVKVGKGEFALRAQSPRRLGAKVSSRGAQEIARGASA
ncbi:non-homologous end-joining DNA ligase LigD [Caballeronia fortuita]|uniref:non-homologous end-joining DNA ligase LigD n=1 Tax=Caballeronia fortuita TaxID=1777138 RepID=UPI0031339158